MSLRTRLFLSFAIITTLAVVTAASEYLIFRRSVDQYHRLTDTLLPAYDTIGEMVDFARELGDQPLAYAFAQTSAERAQQLADFRQTSNEFIALIKSYTSENSGRNADALQASAQELIDRGEQFIQLIDQQAPAADIQAAKSHTEMAEDEFQDLLADGSVSLENELSHDLVSQGADTVGIWTIISIVGSVSTAVLALYILIRFITRPLEQLRISAGEMTAGDYSRRVKVERKDEIGALAIAFNTMADAVEKRQLALTDLNQTLEAKVDDRTEQLRQAKEQSDAILNNTSDAIILIGHDNRIDRINPAFLDLFGYAEAEVTGLTIDRLVNEAQRDRIVDSLLQAARENRHVQLEVTCLRRDGSEFMADATFGTIGAEPYLQHTLCSFHDITPQKRAQQELEEALRKERELGAMKSGFVSLVSHEFRTPLAVIQSSTDLMKRYWDRLDESRRNEKLESIQTQINLMVSYLEDFLTVNGSEIVGAKFAPVQLDALQFSRDLIDELQQAMGANRIRLSAQGDVAQVFVDPKLLRQILVNLLTNALKYSTPGDPVEVEIIPSPEHVAIRVRDQGIGIPEEDQPHLFDPFHRGTNVGNISGTGLGLAIVKRAVEAHRGTISFQSVVGAGTTFTVVFPANSTRETP